jgi:hypothetical protein
MDRDDAELSDRSDEARRGDTGMIGSESEEPGPGRDTSLTDPDPAAASTDQPRGTVAMSEGDPMRTRLGSHLEGAGAIGYDVAAAEEGTTHDTPPEDRPGYESERVADPALGAAGVGAQGGATGVAGTGPGVAATERVDDVGPSDRSVFADEPVTAEPTGRSAFATEDAGPADRSTVADDPARFGAGDAAAGYEGEPGGAGLPGERLDRPGPQEPGAQEGVYDQDADRARRPSDGV